MTATDAGGSTSKFSAPEKVVRKRQRRSVRRDEIRRGQPVLQVHALAGGDRPDGVVRTLHHIDRSVFRLTRGRHTFVSLVTGAPVVMLTTTGARSGEKRTVPVLGLPAGDRVAVIASNFGQRHHPAWYFNLRANPEAEVSFGAEKRRVVAREAEGGERERLWRLGLGIYPGWIGYEKRAGERRIPVIVLLPEESSSRGS